MQSLIEGRDLGINVLCRDGQILAATVQHPIKTSSEPFGTAIGIEFRDDPAAWDVAERLIRELGWSGIANIDMRFDARGKIPLVLELNGRYWFTLLGSLNAGVNFPLLMCEMCLGELKANRKPHRARYFSGETLCAFEPGGRGTFRIRPHETNLRYFDPFPTAIRLTKTPFRACGRHSRACCRESLASRCKWATQVFATSSPYSQATKIPVDTKNDHFDRKLGKLAIALATVSTTTPTDAA